MVVQKIDAKKICTLIRLCKKSQNRAHRQLPSFARVQLHRAEPIKPVFRDTETCEVCKLGVLEAKNYISNTENQKNIVAFVKAEGCSSCPAKAKCEAAIDEYAATVFHFLEQELEGDVLCGLVGLCGKTEHPLTPVFIQLIDVIKNLKYSNVNSGCDICKHEFGVIRAYFANPKVRAAVHFLLEEKLCLLCPSKAKCQADLKQYADKVFAAVDKYLSKSTEICQKIGLCPKSQQHEAPTNQMTSQTQTKKVGGVQCSICEFVMRQLDELLAKNRTEQAIINALDKVCSLLPKTVNDECVSFVNEYGKMIINLLVQELAPEQICTALALCSGEQKIPQMDTTLTFSPLLLRGAPMQKAPLQAKVSPQCVLCEYLMTKLESILAKNATEQEIIHGLEKVCSLMPASLNADCTKMVDEYGPAIIKILVSEMRPAIVCTVLGLCPFAEVAQPKSSEYCEACETAMGYVVSLMKENSTQEELEHLLLKVCNFLPESVRGECNMVVMLYTPEIVQLLLNKVSPQKICTMLKLCSTPTSTKPETFNNNLPVPMLKLTSARRAKNMLGVDTKKCMYGPSYWCASRFNAKKCKMTAHCEEHFWNKNNATKK